MVTARRRECAVFSPSFTHHATNIYTYLNSDKTWEGNKQKRKIQRNFWASFESTWMKSFYLLSPSKIMQRLAFQHTPNFFCDLFWCFMRLVFVHWDLNKKECSVTKFLSLNKTKQSLFFQIRKLVYAFNLCHSLNFFFFYLCA